MRSSVTFVLAGAIVLALSQAGTSVPAADLSTETVLAEIEKGSAEHLARVRSGRGRAEMRYARYHPALQRPRLPGGVIRLDEGRRTSPLPRRTPRVPAGGITTAPTTGTAYGKGVTTVERSESITFAFQGGRLRWDVANVKIRTRDDTMQGAAVRSALVGDTLIEYRPQIDQAATHTLRSQRSSRSPSDEPFDPLHYGVKFFGRPLAELVRETATRTSVTIDAVAGRDLYRLTIAPVGKEDRRRVLWIDPKRGYTIQRYEAVDLAGFVSISLKVEYAPHKNDVWVPRRVEHETSDPKTRAPLTRRTIAFQAFVPNARVRDSEFTLAGMGVTPKTRGFSRGSYGRKDAKPRPPPKPPDE